MLYIVDVRFYICHTALNGNSRSGGAWQVDWLIWYCLSAVYVYNAYCGTIAVFLKEAVENNMWMVTKIIDSAEKCLNGDCKLNSAENYEIIFYFILWIYFTYLYKENKLKSENKFNLLIFS